MNTRKTILICLGLALAIFLSWWGLNRKSIFREKIKATVAKETDSLYKIHYDSAAFDEVAGNAVFYNTRLSIDTAVLDRIKQTDTIPGILLEAKVRTIRIEGLQSLDLLSGNAIDVRSIVLQQPEIKISRPTLEKKEKQVLGDTNDVYQILLGKFKTIRSKAIIVQHGRVSMEEYRGHSKLEATGINMTIKNFVVDSLHPYKSVAAFFVRNMRLTIDSIRAENRLSGENTAATKILYDTEREMLYCHNVQIPGQLIHAINFEGLNIPDFIYRNTFHSRKLLLRRIQLSMDGSAKKENMTLKLGTIFSGVEVDTLQIAEGSIRFTDKKSQTHFFDSITASMYHIKLDSSGLAIQRYAQQYSFSIASLQYTKSSGREKYRWLASNIEYNGNKQAASIGELRLQPVISWAKFAKLAGRQKDYFDLRFNQINFYKFSLSEFIGSNLFKADSMSLKFVLKVYNDRTYPMDSSIKIGQYPHQLIKKLNLRLMIPVVRIRDSYISYMEKGRKSGLIGNVRFAAINGTIRNINNQSGKRIAIEANTTSLFMDTGRLVTKWHLPLWEKNGSFEISGRLTQFPLVSINDIMSPIGLAQVKSGFADKLDFIIVGNDTVSQGSVEFLYNDLKVALLEPSTGEDSLKKKEFASFVANIIVKNKHKDSDRFSYIKERDIYRSMFNLLWRSIAEGAKKGL